MKLAEVSAAKKVRSHCTPEDVRLNHASVDDYVGNGLADIAADTAAAKAQATGHHCKASLGIA